MWSFARKSGRKNSGSHLDFAFAFAFASASDSTSDEALIAHAGTSKAG
jgi:hypothetical protein